MISAGLIALLSLNSCNLRNEFDSTTCVAYLTCNYAGGLPSVNTYNSFTITGPLHDSDVKDIFNSLSEMILPGFVTATLEIDFYDWMNNYDYTRRFEFWWEPTDPISGQGYYAWDEFFIE